MAFLDRLRIRRTRGARVASMDREATVDDLDELRAFARSRTGVEFFVEPETMVTDTTAVAVAADGEWTRRRVGSPTVIRRLGKQLGLPVYDVQIVGYPHRMRVYNERRKAAGEPTLPSQGPPPVRTQRAPQRPPVARPDRPGGDDPRPDPP